MSDIQRTVLPIPDLPRTGLITYDAKDPDTAARAVISPRRPIEPTSAAKAALVLPAA